jgi:putative transposase
VLFLEALRILNMTASAAGTPEEPGRNVKAKAGLNKSILDQGWAEFRRQLTYKEKWHGGLVISVPPHHTSQECPLCDHTEEANRRTRDTFCCQKCSLTAPADLVGAINIKRRGTSLLPVEDPQGPTKQEPFPSRGLPQRKTS